MDKFLVFFIAVGAITWAIVAVKHFIAGFVVKQSDKKIVELKKEEAVIQTDLNKINEEIASIPADEAAKSDEEAHDTLKKYIK